MPFSRKIPDRSIRVSFFDKDGLRVDNITKKQAKEIDAKNPGIKFYFQDKDGLQRELDISQVLALQPLKDLVGAGSDCATGPQPCGPPKIQFFGGGGVGAMANAVISPLSSGVMAFDIVSPGKKYKFPPIAILHDECNKGSGSCLKVLMDGNKVKNVYIPTPGHGYLDKFDGSLGGNGSTWKDAHEGYVKTIDGKYYTVPDDRKPPNLKPGDTWNPPYGPPEVIPDEDGNIPPPIIPVEILPGVEPLEPVESSDPITPEIPPGTPVTPGVPVTPVTPGVPGTPVTPVTPGVPGTPVTSIKTPSYPVLVEFDDFVIEDSGFGYKPGDKITIIPDKGTVLEPVINPRGEVSNVKIISKGVGYEDLPKIIVESDTGFNAIIRPILSVRRITSQEQLFEVPADAKLVYVIDCVGRIPPKETFDVLPK